MNETKKTDDLKKIQVDKFRGLITDNSESQKITHTA